MSAVRASSFHLQPTKDLYNGNIAAWTSFIQPSPPAIPPTLPPALENLTGYTYEYDVLNRLLQADFKSYSGGAWIDPGAMYNASYSYDPNGNIRTLTRDGSQSNPGPMDNLTYQYEQQPVTGEESNRLQHLVESAPSPSPIIGDLEAQPIQQNYSYDEIGELTGDQSESITNIAWTTYGKVASVSKLNQTIEFLYDAQGNRVRKRVYDPANPTDMAETFYVYEAGGKVVAIYENCVDEEPTPHPDSDGDGFTDDVDNCPCVYNPDQLDSDGDGVGDACDQFPGAPDPPPDCDGDGIPNSEDLCPTVAQAAPDDQDGDGFPDEVDQCPCVASETIDCSCVEPYNLVEWVIYGNAAHGRVAEGKPSNISRPASEGTPIAQPVETFTRILDEKYYELKDHLGNARVVVSDMKQPTTESGLAPFAAVLSSYANYYPYGMLQPDRSWQGGQWRYGFNGKEMDDEWSNAGGGVPVTGNAYDFGFRVYETRLARWISTDPCEFKYPAISPYAFVANNPILRIDPDGRKFTYASEELRSAVEAVIRYVEQHHEEWGRRLRYLAESPDFTIHIALPYNFAGDDIHFDNPDTYTGVPTIRWNPELGYEYGVEVNGETVIQRISPAITFVDEASGAWFVFGPDDNGEPPSQDELKHRNFQWDKGNIRGVDPDYDTKNERRSVDDAYDVAKAAGEVKYKRQSHKRDGGRGTIKTSGVTSNVPAQEESDTSE